MIRTLRLIEITFIGMRYLCDQVERAASLVDMMYAINPRRNSLA